MHSYKFSYPNLEHGITTKHCVQEKKDYYDIFKPLKIYVDSPLLVPTILNYCCSPCRKVRIPETCPSPES